jgi:hypothetical protein
MPSKYIAGVVAVLILVLAVWLVPLAFAASGNSGMPVPKSSTNSQTAPSQGSGTTHQCDGSGSASGGTSSNSTNSYQVY